MKGTREQLISSAIKCVSKYGLEGARTQQISEEAGCSTGLLFKYFGSKENLLQECFVYVDKQIARIFDKIIFEEKDILQNPEQGIRTLWIAYYKWLVDHPDETVFYHRYRDNPKFSEFDKTRDASYFASFIMTVNAFQSTYHIYDKVGFHVLWLYVLNVTIMYAKQVANGDLPNDDATMESVFRMMLLGLQGLVMKKTPTADQGSDPQNN